MRREVRNEVFLPAGILSQSKSLISGNGKIHNRAAQNMNVHCFLTGLSQSDSICSRVRPLVSGTNFHIKKAARTLIAL